MFFIYLELRKERFFKKEGSIMYFLMSLIAGVFFLFTMLLLYCCLVIGSRADDRMKLNEEDDCEVYDF